MLKEIHEQPAALRATLSGPPHAGRRGERRGRAEDEGCESDSFRLDGHGLTPFSHARTRRLQAGSARPHRGGPETRCGAGCRIAGTA